MALITLHTLMVKELFLNKTLLKIKAAVIKFFLHLVTTIPHQYSVLTMTTINLNNSKTSFIQTQRASNN